jgi:hypothetical protein
MAFWLAAAAVASTAVSFLGSLNQSRQLRAAAKADKNARHNQAMQENIIAAERAQLFMSEQRAAQGARGVAMNQDSPLLEINNTINDVEDEFSVINTRLTNDLNQIDFRLAGALAKESFNRGVNLIQGAAMSYYAFKSPTPGTQPGTQLNNLSTPTTFIGSGTGPGPAGQSYGYEFNKFFNKYSPRSYY